MFASQLMLYRLALTVVSQRISRAAGLTTNTLAFVRVKFVRRRALLLAKAATRVFVKVLSCGTLVRLTDTLA